MTLADTLRAARALIEDESRWCVGSYARNGRGKDVAPWGRYPVRYCAAGALMRAGSNDGIALGITVVMRRLGVDCLTEFNDNHTHPEVLALFDRAIEIAEAQP